MNHATRVVGGGWNLSPADKRRGPASTSRPLIAKKNATVHTWSQNSPFTSQMPVCGREQGAKVPRESPPRRHANAEKPLVPRGFEPQTFLLWDNTVKTLHRPRRPILSSTLNEMWTLWLQSGLLSIKCQKEDIPSCWEGRCLSALPKGFQVLYNWNDNKDVPFVVIWSYRSEFERIPISQVKRIHEGCHHAEPGPVRCSVRLMWNAFRQEPRHLARKSIWALFFFSSSDTAESQVIRRLAGQFPATAARVPKCFWSFKWTK